MSKMFSTFLLIQDGLSTPELEKTEVILNPGKGFSHDKGDSILLAGGFRSISVESGFALSPTLQLNSDLTNALPEELKRIALAELNRHNEINYRSYEVDANKRVCVIGSDLNQLQEFIDIYDGLIEIAPLLTKGSSEEIPTALELTVGKGKNGCRLEYQVQSPINLDICTYCGACGPSCPEHCLSENLFIDFNKCTYCKECEAVCPVGAIDVHGAVIEVLDIPAIILLDGQEIEAPEVVDNIFTEQNISKYLATLYPCQIDEVVTCNNSICQYSSRLGFGCKICQNSCQFGAISIVADGIHVDGLKCEECGACVSACPTGALQNERFNDKAFFNYFRSINLPTDGTVVLGAEKSLHNFWWHQKDESLQNVFFLQYENVASLSHFHFTHLLNSGARRVVLIKDEAENSRELDKAVGLTNQIISGLFGIEDVVAQVQVDQLQKILQTEAPGSLGSDSESSQSFINRRQMFGQSLEQLMLRSGQEMTITAELGSSPFARVICDSEKCTHCMACINDCRIEALIADQEQLTLNHHGVMCVGCGICIRVCPEDALSFSPDVPVTQSSFVPVELAVAEAMKCKKCGKVFGTKKSFDRVMEILRQKETVDTDHFEYCETCRVVNLFEAE